LSTGNPRTIGEAGGGPLFAECIDGFWRDELDDEVIADDMAGTRLGYMCDAMRRGDIAANERKTGYASAS
jgi:hypothetical protein